MDRRPLFELVRRCLELIDKSRSKSNIKKNIKKVNEEESKHGQDIETVQSKSSRYEGGA